MIYAPSWSGLSVYAHDVVDFEVSGFEHGFRVRPICRHGGDIRMLGDIDTAAQLADAMERAAAELRALAARQPAAAVE